MLLGQRCSSKGAGTLRFLCHCEIIKIDGLEIVGTANTGFVIISHNNSGFILKRKLSCTFHNLYISIFRSCAFAPSVHNLTSCNSTLTWSWTSSRPQVLEHGCIPRRFANLEATRTVVDSLRLLQAGNYRSILNRKSINTR